MFKEFVKRLLPDPVAPYARRIYQVRVRARIKSLPSLTEEMFDQILTQDLGLKNGDVVFVHNSIGQLNLAFPFYRCLYIIQSIVGENGTMLFVTYPQFKSYEYLLSGQIFDVRDTPSYTGILSEFARKQKHARRSLHPTKSVCAIGRYAKELTNTHQQSPFPYDNCSPYYKIMEYDGIIIGLGVSTTILSFVHCVDDALKDEFPVEPYHKTLFHAKCINYDGNIEVVKTFAHNNKMMNHNIPRYMKKYVPEGVCKDIIIDGMKFYTAKARYLFNLMADLAKKNITIYPKQVSNKKREWK